MYIRAFNEGVLRRLIAATCPHALARSDAPNLVGELLGEPEVAIRPGRDGERPTVRQGDRGLGDVPRGGDAPDLACNRGVCGRSTCPARKATARADDQPIRQSAELCSGGAGLHSVSPHARLGGDGAVLLRLLSWLPNLLSRLAHGSAHQSAAGQMHPLQLGAR